jgi:hypothetical protein
MLTPEALRVKEELRVQRAHRAARCRLHIVLSLRALLVQEYKY